jgi:hypothetical protein
MKITKDNFEMIKGKRLKWLKANTVWWYIATRITDDGIWAEGYYETPTDKSSSHRFFLTEDMVLDVYANSKLGKLYYDKY